MALTLAKVETAIEALLSGAQSFTIDGMSVTQNSMDSLMKMRTQLKNESGNAFGFRMRPLKPPEH